MDERVAMIVAIDLETTGLHCGVDRVIEIAAVRFAMSGEVLSRFESLVNPGRAIPAESMRVHGLRDEDVRCAAVMEEVLPQFVEWLGGVEGAGHLIAHHAAFDAGFLGWEAERLGMDLGMYEVIDTLPLAQRRWPDAPSCRLEVLANWLGLGVQVTHRALADAEVLRRLWCALGVPVEAARDRYRMASRLERVDLPSPLAGLRERVEAGQVIRIVYQGGRHGRAPRCVTPLSLQGMGGLGYLVGWCHIEGIVKRFQLERIRSYDVVSDLPQAGAAGRLGT